jgi:uncharacterized membrane protein
VSATEWYLVGLRVAHALAAMAWLGGGVYYLLALRPAGRSIGASAADVTGAAQRAFGEWAQIATVVMLGTGAVLMFERLSDGDGGITYAALLAGKVVAALAAFWFAGVRPVRRSRRRAPSRRVAPELIVALGTIAFVLGVILSSVFD